LDRILIPTAAGEPAPFEPRQDDLARAAWYARAEKSAATQKAYGSDFGVFGLWCQEHEFPLIPTTSEAIAAYLAFEADRGAKPSTIARRLAAIRYVHGIGGHPNPTNDERVRAVIRGIRRTHGTAPRRVLPATADRLLAMAPRPDGGLSTLRDRALLLLGFAGALRRSELVALDVADLEETPEGLRVTIRRGKTDAEGRGAVIAILRGEVACPVAALREWLRAAEITDGPLFRSIRRGGHVQNTRLTDRTVATIVKRYAAQAGFDPMLFSGHSLRAGFLTSAAKRGASVFKMMASSRHRSIETLSAYVRDQELFKDHAGSGLSEMIKPAPASRSARRTTRSRLEDRPKRDSIPCSARVSYRGKLSLAVPPSDKPGRHQPNRSVARLWLVMTGAARRVRRPPPFRHLVT
jgi:site-specific recombinase XerD